MYTESNTAANRKCNSSCASQVNKWSRERRMKYEYAKPKAERIEVESILTVSDRLRINIFISPLFSCN